MAGAIADVIRSAVMIVVLSLAGCAVSAGGFSFSLLQDASVTLNTGSRDGGLADANSPK